MLPSHLFPGSDRSSSEDEDYGSDIQRPPDEEGQGSSTAPHRGQPGQADEKDGTQTENHTHHWQSGYMDVNVLRRDGRKLQISVLMAAEQSYISGMSNLNLQKFNLKAVISSNKFTAYMLCGNQCKMLLT